MESLKERHVLVYVISNEVNGLVKIGSSKDVERRFRELQCGSPVRLKVEETFEVQYGRELEAWLFHVFKDERKHGEWFDLGPRFLERIRHAVAAFW